MRSLTLDMPRRYERWARRLPDISLHSLRWATVVLPVCFLIAVDYARHFIFPFAFHDWPGFLALWGGALFGALLFSKVVFDAIERMQKAANQRNRELSILHAAAYQQVEQLKALREAGMALTAELALETVLQKVVDLSRELVEARYGAIAVFDEANRIERFITSGVTPEEKARIGSLPQGQGVMGFVRDEGKPLRISDIRRHPHAVGFPPSHPSMKILLGIPIISKGCVIGTLKLAEKRGGGEFTQEDEDRVMMLVAQAAIAIQNAKLYEQEQALAVLQERERIAQDLHDGIIQEIYAIGLGLERCIEQATAGYPEVAERLGMAVDDLNGIIKDVRNYIFVLQPADLSDAGLEEGLDHIAQEFRINSLVDAEVSVKGDVDDALSSDQVGQLFQIAREALTNVLKHAHASAVTLEISRLAEYLELSVADNGVGFDLAKASGKGLGLRNISERAKSLGGCFTIDSRPGLGAKLSIRVPVKSEEGDELCSVKPQPCVYS